MKRVGVLSLALLFLWPKLSIAIFGIGDIVHDPINLIQNTLIAVRQLQSNVHEITQINQQIQALANDARALASLPFSVISQVQQTISTYNNLLQQGKGMVYQVQASVKAFDQLFTGNMPFDQRMMGIWNEINNAGRMGIQIQSIYDQLCESVRQMEQLMNASQAAIGPMQVQQAQAQLLGVLGSQQNGMFQLQATTARLETLMAMRQMELEEQARLNAQAWLADWPTGAPRGPGQGRGPTP